MTRNVKAQIEVIACRASYTLDMRVSIMVATGGV